MGACTHVCDHACMSSFIINRSGPEGYSLHFQGAVGARLLSIQHIYRAAVCFKKMDRNRARYTCGIVFALARARDRPRVRDREAGPDRPVFGVLIHGPGHVQDIKARLAGMRARRRRRFAGGRSR